MYNGIRYIPWGVDDRSEDFVLEPFRISMFDLFAVPQRGTPYVQIGLRIVLYISRLVSSGSFDFLPMSQYILWNCRPSCFLLVNIRGASRK